MLTAQFQNRIETDLRDQLQLVASLSRAHDRTG